MEIVQKTMGKLQILLLETQNKIIIKIKNKIKIELIKLIELRPENEMPNVSQYSLNQIGFFVDIIYQKTNINKRVINARNEKQL